MTKFRCVITSLLSNVLVHIFHPRQKAFDCTFKLRDRKLPSIIKNDCSVKQIVQLMCALAFVPVNDVVKYFDPLKHTFQKAVSLIAR